MKSLNFILLFNYINDGKCTKTRGVIVNENSDICYECNFENEYEVSIGKKQGMNKRIYCILRTLTEYLEMISIESDVYNIYVPLKEIFTGEIENYIRFGKTEYDINLDNENIELYKKLNDFIIKGNKNFHLWYSKFIFTDLKNFKLDHEKLNDFEFRLSGISTNGDFNKNVTINSTKGIWEKEIYLYDSKKLKYSICKYKEDNYILFLMCLIDVVCQYLDTRPVYYFDNRYNDCLIHGELGVCVIREFADEDVITQMLKINNFNIESISRFNKSYYDLSIIFIGSYGDVINFNDHIIDYNEIGMKIILSNGYKDNDIVLNIDAILLKGLLSKVYDKFNSKEYIDYVKNHIIRWIMEDKNNYSFNTNQFGQGGIVFNNEVNAMEKQNNNEQNNTQSEYWY